ncbi:MAG: hypothetical protein HFK07_02720 [Clostridia bacterium]|jgi:uncharacterized membrane protein YccF (DUF307 family)|nr:hypothetical protein [Clostridia bacterium]MCX4366746.1 hypothetical protein [Clostridia bacterium]
MGKVIRFGVKFIANSMWKIVGGLFLALFWTAVAVALSLTLIGFPIALKCYRIAYFAWKPFGRCGVVSIVKHPVFNIVWGLTVGLFFLMFSIFWVALLSITIIGLPFAYQWLKVMRVTIFPFGVVIV